MKIRFFVPGIPKPGGSKRAFVNKKTGRAQVVDACAKSADWKADVKDFASKAHSTGPLFGPLQLEITFFMPRPKNHYGTGKKAATLKETAPYYHTSAPDTTKLIRSLEDALKGVIWGDDAQVAVQGADKVYSDVPGALVTITKLLRTKA